MARRKRRSDVPGLIPIEFDEWIDSQGIDRLVAAAIMGAALEIGYNDGLTRAIAAIPEHGGELVDLILDGPKTNPKVLRRIGDAARGILMAPPSPEVSEHAQGKR